MRTWCKCGRHRHGWTGGGNVWATTAAVAAATTVGRCRLRPGRFGARIRDTHAEYFARRQRVHRRTSFVIGQPQGNRVLDGLLSLQSDLRTNTHTQQKDERRRRRVMSRVFYAVRPHSESDVECVKQTSWNSSLAVLCALYLISLGYNVRTRHPS